LTAIIGRELSPAVPTPGILSWHPFMSRHRQKLGFRLTGGGSGKWLSTLEFELRSRESFATKAIARTRVAAWIDEYNREPLYPASSLKNPETVVIKQAEVLVHDIL
jgi:hypothetical protein